MLQLQACAIMLGSHDFLDALQVISKVHRVFSIFDFLWKLLISLWYAFELMRKLNKEGMPVYRTEDRNDLGIFF